MPIHAGIYGFTTVTVFDHMLYAHSGYGFAMFAHDEGVR